jgi:thiamine biosynthesis lipoprotein
MLPLLLIALLAGAPPALAGPPVHLEGTAFGQPFEIDALGTPPESVRQTLDGALAEIRAVERLTDPARADGGLKPLNDAAGQGAQTVSPELLALLQRGQSFCVWTEGAFGPLGGDLLRAWGVSSNTPAIAPPSPERLLQATAAAGCDRLGIDVQKSQAALLPGSVLDFSGFAAGEAVDRAVEALKRNGATAGRVRIGGVYRAFGDGPGGKGKGWTVALPAFKGMSEPAGPVVLRDRAVAIADAFGGLYLHQRTGQPVQGGVAVVAVTEMARDAQPLAASLLVTGPREGQLRIGSLRPRPSILWLMGNGQGAPLRIFYRWSEVTPRPPA